MKVMRLSLISVNGYHSNHKSKLNFGDLPRVQILRRGIRKTKLSIDSKIYQIPNETLDKILLSYDVLDDKVFDEVSQIISDGLDLEE